MISPHRLRRRRWSTDNPAPPLRRVPGGRRDAKGPCPARSVQVRPVVRPAVRTPEPGPRTVVGKAQPTPGVAVDGAAGSGVPRSVE